MIRISLPSRFFIAACIIFVLALGHEGSAASRRPVKAQNGMVVAAESLAAAAGVEVLRSGGNAIDAAVAVAFALAVTYPEAGNIGGGGFMVIRLASADAAMIDFREKAPAAASSDMFLDGKGNPIPEKSLYGPLAAGVPGTVAGLLLALGSYGTMSREAVMRRAIELAEQGFSMDERLAMSLQYFIPRFSAFPSTTHSFTNKGEPYSTGDVFKQPELAKTLRAIRDRGADGFYGGEVAELIVAEMKRSGGIISRQDLAEYEPVVREPLVGSYRGFDIISSSPPSAGGIGLIEMLNILERYDMRSKGSNSSASIHLIAAAAQRAFSDRAAYIGDPQFDDILIDELSSKAYATTRTIDLDSTKATPSAAIKPGIITDTDEQQTTHYCVADKFGNVVSATVTLNDSYGCKTVVGGAGFLLNNEMDDFTAKPGVPNLYGLVGTDINAIKPGKRMVSSMTPTIVLKDDLPFLVLGARGGSRIITAVAQVIVNVVDFGMNVQEAVDAPRIHHQHIPDKLLYERGIPADVVENLRRMGYVVEEIPDANGRAHALWLKDGYFLGGPDPRENGVALGY